MICKIVFRKYEEARDFASQQGGFLFSQIFHGCKMRHIVTIREDTN